MAYQISPLRGVRERIIMAGGAAAPGVILAPPPSFTHHIFYIIGGAGIASGAVQPESASESDYAGTWAQIGGGPIAVVADTELQAAFEGAFSFIRCRISTLMGGGTVTVDYMGY